MKAFTNIEQSKKLAEILPIESADMRWREVTYGFYHIEVKIPKGWYNVPPKGIPCWSLAALLNISPYIEVGRELYGAHHGKWYSRYTTGDYQYKTIADNLIDACYEMILKLHEQKLI